MNELELLHRELRQVIEACKLSETDAMNDLQSVGVVSDNCVWITDIDTRDCQNAIEYLKMTFPPFAGPPE